MKFQKIAFILSLIGILLLIFLTQNTKQPQTGKISSINFFENRIIIKLENFEKKLVLFDTQIINLKIGDKISFQGRNDIYQNENQLIIDKIEKISK